METFKKIALFLVAVALLYLLSYGYGQLNEGFSVGEIRSTLPYYPEVDIATTEEAESIASILDQKFTYLGKGTQFYVFASADGNYVLKLLKQKHLRPPAQLVKLPLPTVLREKVLQKKVKREKKVERLFTSCALSFRELQEESGLVFIHLHQKPCMGKNVTLVNKLGIAHKIWIDDYEFILQRRGVECRKTFTELLAEGKEEEVRKKLCQLAELVERRSAKGIANRDRSFVKNVGFTSDGKRALLLDVGQLTKDQEELSRRTVTEDIVFRLSDIRFWAKDSLPELVPYIDDVLKQQKKV